MAAEEGISDQIMLTTEAGAIGGVPAGLKDFGHSYNPQALVDMHSQFDFYDGGGLDLAVLGLAQTDSTATSTSRSSAPGSPAAAGSSTSASRPRRWCSPGRSRPAACEVEVVDGELRITTEGRARKFLDDVEQITFSGPYSAKSGQRVLYVTERAVFELIAGVMTLIEIAPGIDLERDVLAHLAFTPAISPDLAPMPAGIFRESWGELASLLNPERSAQAAALS